MTSRRLVLTLAAPWRGSDGWSSSILRVVEGTVAAVAAGAICYWLGFMGVPAEQRNRPASNVEATPVAQTTLLVPPVVAADNSGQPSCSRPANQFQEPYELQLTALGSAIAPNSNYGANDLRFSSGSNLVVSVQYEGAIAGHTELAIEWFVGQNAVSFFEPVKLPDRAGLWSRTYDNATVAPGQHRIILKVDGIPRRELQFHVDGPSGT